MLIIKFNWGDSKITWFMNDNWVILISYLLTTLMIQIVKITVHICKPRKIKMANPKGGEFIDECIEPDSIYELVDPNLQVAVRQALDLTGKKGPLIITAPVLMFAYIIAKNPIIQVVIGGFTVATDNFKIVALKPD